MKPIDQARNALAFLEDHTHEHAFDKLIWGLRERRDAAAREVPEWEQLRMLASEIKEHTLSNLAHYLELFEARAKRNGAQVHWARDAHEHNQIVYEILSSHGVERLVKSKSMLTEECDTRAFLGQRRIEVTETDLGERIQQLDDEPPSHIVGPAFQKTPQDVADLFHRAYGTIVRTPLGVAETGSILVTEKELEVNTIAVLAQHLVVLLDPADLVENIHDAYRHPGFQEAAYAVLLSGPSGSADIGGKTVHPAQGVTTLTVILSPRPGVEEEPEASNSHTAT